MLRALILCIFTVQVTWLCAQPKNILIGSTNKPEEPSICIDPGNASHILAAANINNVYVSWDAGKSWYHEIVESDLGVWGDPVIVADDTGRFYFFHLSNPKNGSWIDRIVCQYSTDGGHTWSEGKGIGKDGKKAQDKHWVAVDKDRNLYVTWTQFDKYGSKNPEDRSNILFSKSTDGGESWTPAKRINQVSGDCIDSSLTTEGAVPAIGPNGEVYVSWAGPAGLVFDKSIDGGDSWLEEDIMIDALKTGWTFEVPGIYRCNGLPITVCDISGGKHHGTIYVNWADQRNGPDDTDIWLSKSTDGGTSWSDPIRVNDDQGTAHQFFTWMTIDQSTGYLYVVFYDRRAYEDENTDVYLAISKDGGQTFENQKISEKPFKPNKKEFFGDYNNISAVNGVVRPIWTRMDDRKLSIWTALIGESDTKGEKEGEISIPNFNKGWTEIKFKLKATSKVGYEIQDLSGRVLMSYPPDNFEAGKNLIMVPKAIFPSSGKYPVKLNIDGDIKTRKIKVRVD